MTTYSCRKHECRKVVLTKHSHGVQNSTPHTGCLQRYRHNIFRVILLNCVGDLIDKVVVLAEFELGRSPVLALRLGIEVSS